MQPCYAIDCRFFGICDLAQTNGTHRPKVAAIADAGMGETSTICVTRATGEWAKVLIPEKVKCLN